ncbi:putative disease resistance protein RGA1 [Prunus dulcis]|uniref:putative disease resistance protein RGA1 n=1 Tax=Prunus dulcis TaxID=3755 RepID=UPI001481E93B|nr:putative disease resistance protein RGA1 [Prunus dulcis]XP_034216525.1 putative disease resistance protein RGA1 [Prunus dulcis]XP_034216534.1 putative disease resistance protein RGA1 [Prunus dulcis]XP_034216541.1 putative disease resistance protein RGA1 [Prunus dulcis]
MASVLTFATEGILTKLTSLAAHEISLAWGFKAELNRLRKTLSTIEGYLADVAQGPQGRSKTSPVEDWVTNLKRLAKDADDVLDEFNYELLRRKVEIRNHMKKKVLNFFSLSNPVAFRLKIAHKIQKINASLKKLKSDASVIGLVSNKIDAVPQRIGGRIQTDSFPEKDGIIFGREEVVSNIVTTLTNSNINQENLAVMAIVGMAGLGKTTLAKSVYNNNSVKKYFEKRIWVCVSDPFNINVILICMLESLDPSKATVRENQDALVKYLEEELREKRYLLVLDDVWNEESEKWESLMTYLSKLNSAPGSKIIVTTRSGKVASLTETLPRPELELLSTDECWSILKHAACSDGSSDIPLGLERIGREIAKNCEGLPLMAKVLGGILRSKKTPAEWSEVKDSRIWDLPKAEDRIMSVLKLSFDNLESPALKQCFSYCSAFMKDAKMERDNLIQLWMAQGFLHPSPEKNNLEMEDIGNEYFDILFQSSLFQNATVDDDGIVTECKMHDLVHDLAERVSETESMMRDFHNEDVATPIIERIPEGSSGKLRSLFSNAEALTRNMLPGFKALRVLNLYEADIMELPSSIEKLKHLRYLNISETRIERLPNSIGKLYNLQTLRATNCGLKEFPKAVQNLINLRYVYCDEGTKFPAGVLRRLTSLRKLPCSLMGSEIEDLAALNQLKGKLIIRNLEDVRNGDEASKAKLEEKKKVRHFLFEWTQNRSTTNNNEEDVLEGLQPHSELERLEIRYFMGTEFPSWMIKLDNLKQIRLKGCDRCEKVPTLGRLPHLTVVWIQGCCGLQSIPDLNLFTSLRELSIESCDRLESLVSSGPVNVVKLLITGCSGLQSIPDLNLFTSLRKLTIGSCDRLESLVSSGPVYIVKLLNIIGCGGLQSIPDLNLFTSLHKLRIESCDRLESLVSSGPVNVVELLKIIGCSSLQSIPDLSLFTSLSKLSIKNCERLESLVSSGPVNVVGMLNVTGCSNLQSIPDLSLFTSLSELRITFCERLESLVSSGPVNVVEMLYITRCSNLQSIPDLSLFTSLSKLSIKNCERLESLVSSGPVNVVEMLNITSCSNLQSIPDLSLFTFVRVFFIEYCDRLESLVSSGPINVEFLYIRGCNGLESLPDLKLFTSLRYLGIKSCDGIRNVVVTVARNGQKTLNFVGDSRTFDFEFCGRFPNIRL